MSQANDIRNIVLEMLQSENSIQDNIVVNNKNILGIRYNELKKHLLSNDNFTDGAVTGALYTLEDRVPEIHKIKTKNGVFFYFSKNKSSEKPLISVRITDSNEYEKLNSQAENILEIISNILLNTSHNDYKDTDETDVKYLREVLKTATQLNDLLRKYKIDKSFDDIERSISGYELPF